MLGEDGKIDSCSSDTWRLRLKIKIENIDPVVENLKIRECNCMYRFTTIIKMMNDSYCQCIPSRLPGKSLSLAIV